MPPSQLKRLKASLRENGITGPQQSKKSRKQQKNGAAPDLRVQRQNALANLREEFNPFEVKAPNRPRKFDVTSNRPDVQTGVVGRPGLSKSVGEEARRRTLLPEIHRRNKTGGIVDRRIGENDPTMTPEERMLQRFTREKSRKKGAIFDLEDGDEDEHDTLTHAGKALAFDDDGSTNVFGEKDDFDGDSLESASDDGGDIALSLKRLRDADGELEPDAEEQPERKKTKAEVMKEVIAKSKLHKYERQQAKEEDDELREELDKGLPDLLALLRGHSAPKPTPAPTVSASHNGDFGINPDRAALLQGMDREVADKEYDKRLRQMVLDRRAKPTERTKTDEEKALEDAQRLKDLETRRQRRMRGEEDSEEEDFPASKEVLEADEDFGDDGAEFGLPSTHLTTSLQPNGTRPEGVDDEDDFMLDDDMIASGSEADEIDSSDLDDSDEESDHEPEDFEFVTEQYAAEKEARLSGESQLAFTYPCPQTHTEFLGIIKDIPITETPIIVQRIRALYAPQLAAGNKEKLAVFSSVLVDHIAYMACTTPPSPLSVIETLIRHIHSLSRTHPEAIARAFRSHLQTLHASNAPTSGDMVILTAISSIYPTSDHFHQVVTPAITLMARWLGLINPQSRQELSIGAYIGALCLKYQGLSKRYIPEAVRYTVLALQYPGIPEDLLDAHVKNLLSMAELWANKSAFMEIFSPAALKALSKLPKQTPAVRKLKILLSASRASRRPLELHHHKPMAIKTFIPKFEDSYDPTKHYDPDKERSDAAKLRAEYKRERKGAMRELRKDANFIAREQLREKKERDRAYEEKYRKLVASIQAEEGHEANQYEKVKKARKGAR